jgi:hypothetical protein
MSKFIKSCLLASTIILTSAFVLATEEAAVPATEHDAVQVDATTATTNQDATTTTKTTKKSKKKKTKKAKKAPVATTTNDHDQDTIAEKPAN